MLENQTEIIKLKSSLIKYFESEKNSEITGILRASRPSTLEIGFDSWNGGIYTYALLLEMEIKEFLRYKPILEQVKNEIFTIVELFTQNTCNEYIGEVRFIPLCKQYFDWSALDGITTKEGILQQIETIKNMLISVATGGSRIQSREEEYKTGYNSLNGFLAKLGIENPNKFKNLWDWYDRWSQPDLPSYALRRIFIAKLYQPVIDLLENSSGDAVSINYEPTGWERVDRTVYEMKRRLTIAETEEQFQAIGMLGRDTLISIAQQVYDKTRHKANDGLEPSITDAKRMLDIYLACEVVGRSNECLRKFAKSAVDMANELTHDRTATRRDASLCLASITAVSSLIKLIDVSKEPISEQEDDIPF